MMNIEGSAWVSLPAVMVALVLFAIAYLALAPHASANTTDCPSGKICLWSGPTFGGEKSFWNASETGCHALEGIDPQSLRNNTTNREVYSPVNVLAGLEYQWFSPYGGGFCFK